jgi:gamma-glutamyltranspeptidase/glutathione hydrolase
MRYSPARTPLLVALTSVLVASCGGKHATPVAGAVSPAAAMPPEQVEPVESDTTPPAEAAAPINPRIAPAWPLSRRARVTHAAHAMVASAHQLASAVGADILQRGGNAIDAAVAVGFALAVVQPVAGNIGGGGFMVIRLTDGSVYALDYREVAPRAARQNMYVDSAGNVLVSSLTGHLSVGVPGSVAGMFEAHRRFGHLPWADLLAPAVKLARDGHTIDAVRSRNIALEAHRLVLFPASRALLLQQGEALPPGTLLVQPDLARTLQLIADSGPPAFYSGSIANLMVDEMKRGAGIITKEDLAGYQAKWRTPLRIVYRRDTVYTMPPPSGGGVTLAEILNVTEGYPTLPPFGSVALMHLQAEAMRRAFIDRNAYLGDPDFVTLPLDRLLSKEYAARLRQNIDPARATPTPANPATRSEGTETTHYSVVDAAGNAVACTTTLNNDFGSAVTVAGAGFLLNDEMDDFTTAPGRPNLYGLIQSAPNAIAPGKRMLSAMTPTIVVDSTGQLLLVLGTPGGSRITTAVYQVLSNVLDQGMPLGEAVAAPRLHQQGLPDILYLENDGFPDATADSLEAMGYHIERWRYKTGVNAIAREAGGWVGIADPRRGGGAVGY